jgi:hypothetical protein
MNVPKGKHTPPLFAGSNFGIEGSKKWNLIVVKGFNIPERNKKKKRKVFSIMIKKEQDKQQWIAYLGTYHPIPSTLESPHT